MENKMDPTQEVKKIAAIVDLKLTIPEYQRPYKWKSDNVVQLLDDIFENVVLKEKDYRIGSIILHKENEILNVVDGQQRLTTMSILLHLLKSENVLLLNQDFKHKISQDNIVYNARVINNWLIKISSKETFKNQILEKCEFVLFTVFNQDEAFQLFDSQNARGKALEPYDLLKAFHLREMECDSEKDKANAVENWEKSVDNGTLKPILSNHLFRIRKWAKNEKKYDFSKGDIDEFKGISLQNKQQYPYESALRMLDGFVENAKNDKFLRNSHLSQQYPFSITMPIINGKRFFEYVQHYLGLKKEIFSEKNNSEFYQFYEIYCLGTKLGTKHNEVIEGENKYNGAGRSGDIKVRNLYENILMIFRDKFGTADFNDFYQPFYKAVYKIRCENKSIRLETILNSDEMLIIRLINDYVDTSKLKMYQYKVYKTNKPMEELTKGISIIKKFIDNNGESK